MLLRGSVTEKLRWAFNLYDINKDGYITKEVHSTTFLTEEKTYCCPNFCRCTVCLSVFLQEMMAIMTSIYDMMGRYTLPSVRDDSPFEHVERFFQVSYLCKHYTTQPNPWHLNILLHPDFVLIQDRSMSHCA